MKINFVEFLFVGIDVVDVPRKSAYKRKKDVAGLL
jgi:hypothetical protein